MWATSKAGENILITSPYLPTLTSRQDSPHFLEGRSGLQRTQEAQLPNSTQDAQFSLLSLHRHYLPLLRASWSLLQAIHNLLQQKQDPT